VISQRKTPRPVAKAATAPAPRCLRPPARMTFPIQLTKFRNAPSGCAPFDPAGNVRLWDCPKVWAKTTLCAAKRPLRARRPPFGEFTHGTVDLHPMRSARSPRRISAATGTCEQNRADRGEISKVSPQTTEGREKRPISRRRDACQRARNRRTCTGRACVRPIDYTRVVSGHTAFCRHRQRRRCASAAVYR